MMGMMDNAVDMNQQEESDVLHLFLSMRVKTVIRDDDEDDAAEEVVEEKNVEQGHGVYVDSEEEETKSIYHEVEDDKVDTFLQIFTLVNLRALTHEFRLKSEWLTKFAEFFSVDTLNENKRRDDCSPPLQNVTNVYVNA